MARRYCDVILAHRQQPERVQFSSKTGWAMLQVHADRPDAALTAYAEGVGRRLLELQKEDGNIDLSGWPGMEAGAPPAREAHTSVAGGRSESSTTTTCATPPESCAALC